MVIRYNEIEQLEKGFCMMGGKISFYFDTACFSQYEQIFEIFEKWNVVGCIGCRGIGENNTDFHRLRQIQTMGWEILSLVTPDKDMSCATVCSQIEKSKAALETEGFKIRQLMIDMPDYDAAIRAMMQKNYDGVFSRYIDTEESSIEKMVIRRPVNRYELRRCSIEGKKIEQLKYYVDYLYANDEWLVLCCHDIDSMQDEVMDILNQLIQYCLEKGVTITTTSMALDMEKCRVKIIRDGYDGKKCYVHARLAAHGNKMLITSQLMDVKGSDCFEMLQTNFSRDGGKAWTNFVPEEAFTSWYHDGIRTVCSDMTPMYHKKTGKFLITGHTVDYFADSIRIARGVRSFPQIPYAVFDENSMKFCEYMYIEMPDNDKFLNCGSGCCQCYELENGDILIPTYFREQIEGVVQPSKVVVLRCSFDGKEIRLLEIGHEIEMADEVRGLAEPSLMFYQGKFYCTIRGDKHGYICTSEDGLNYSEPKVWRWDDGEILPTYNTQSHWLRSSEGLYLVYTRKNGENDHVFRHRAPLYVGRVDTEKLAIVRDSEFVAVPERGARLGNFGAFSGDGDSLYVVASEWMQPIGCEAYGSNNALWLADITL